MAGSLSVFLLGSWPGLLPWLAVAGAGALHGLNPATGWALAAALGLRAGEPRQALHALAPMALGHAASVALVACSAALGFAAYDATSRVVLVAPLALLAALHACRRAATRGKSVAALWSFLAASAHGAGMMLVPALAPFCLADDPARAITASGSLLLALAAVGVHMGAMLAATAALAWIATAAGRRLRRSATASGGPPHAGRS